MTTTLDPVAAVGRVSKARADAVRADRSAYSELIGRLNAGTAGPADEAALVGLLDRLGLTGEDATADAAALAKMGRLRAKIEDRRSQLAALRSQADLDADMAQIRIDQAALDVRIRKIRSVESKRSNLVMEVSEYESKANRMEFDFGRVFAPATSWPKKGEA
jgi:hypothetical protein